MPRNIPTGFRLGLREALLLCMPPDLNVGASTFFSHLFFSVCICEGLSSSCSFFFGRSTPCPLSP